MAPCLHAGCKRREFKRFRSAFQLGRVLRPMLRPRQHQRVRMPMIGSIKRRNASRLLWAKAVGKPGEPPRPGIRIINIMELILAMLHLTYLTT
jgi:hypothetical protein